MIVVAVLAALKIHVIVCFGRAGLQPRGCNTGCFFYEMLAFCSSGFPLPVTLIYAAQKSPSYALGSYKLLYLNLILNIYDDSTFAATASVDTEHLRHRSLHFMSVGHTPHPLLSRPFALYSSSG